MLPDRNGAWLARENAYEFHQEAIGKVKEEIRKASQKGGFEIEFPCKDILPSEGKALFSCFRDEGYDVQWGGTDGDTVLYIAWSRGYQIAGYN